MQAMPGWIFFLEPFGSDLLIFYYKYKENAFPISWARVLSKIKPQMMLLADVF